MLWDEWHVFLPSTTSKTTTGIVKSFFVGLLKSIVSEISSNTSYFVWMHTLKMSSQQHYLNATYMFLQAFSTAFVFWIMHCRIERPRAVFSTSSTSMFLLSLSSSSTFFLRKSIRDNLWSCAWNSLTAWPLRSGRPQFKGLAARWALTNRLPDVWQINSFSSSFVFPAFLLPFFCTLLQRILSDTFCKYFFGVHLESNHHLPQIHILLA